MGLAEAGIHVPGFDAEVTGNLPAGWGLSSSAAFEVATALFLLKIAGASLSSMEIARLCQRAENDFVGVRCGLLDQATSVFGRANHLVLLDFRTDEVRQLPFPPGLALVIADSGAPHSLRESDYGQRRAECEAAAAALGVRALRDASEADLPRLDPLLRRRAAHIVGENDRVLRSSEAVANGNIDILARAMNASHESSRTLFENSTRELDLLVEIARSLPGVLASRLTGGGFGGGTVSLVETAHASTAAQELALRYSDRSGHRGETFVSQVAAGATVTLES